MAATTPGDRPRDPDTDAIVSFFLTGMRTGGQLDPVDDIGLRPALYAGYRDLTELRYDFPVVLVADRSDGECIQSLSKIVDAALAKVAKGGEADRIRKHALLIERRIRVLVAAGADKTLRALWDEAAGMPADPASGETDGLVADSARRVRAALGIDGAVVDCDARTPMRMVRHAWSARHAQKALVFRTRIERIVAGLSDILKADDERSGAGSNADRLAASIAPGFGAAFDFDAMAAMLSNALPRDPLPASRRARIGHLLEVLSGQDLFTDGEPGDANFDSQISLFSACDEALDAWHRQMPRRIEVSKAIAVAELELDGRYNESRHDPLFAHFGAGGLEADELAQFPDPLVVLDAGSMTAADHDRLMEIFFSRLPIKVLLKIDDILEPATEGRATTGARARQVASMAIGLNEVFVLQTGSSHLLRLRDRILRALDYRGPALLSVFSGTAGAASDMCAYLVSAAAVESRAFPAFVYDPSAGADWSSRFSLAANPQVELDWPIQGLRYEDEQHQSVAEEVAFTYVDFAAADRRYATHLARIPRSRWNGGTAAVDEMLARERRGFPDKVPSVMMVDGDDHLQRVVVDEWLVREARRCRAQWRSLQELGGIHNSHAEKLVARERAAWEERMRQQAEALSAQPAVAGSAAKGNSPAPGLATPSTAIPVATAATDPAATGPVPEPEPERSPDTPWIDTPRCSTCEECIHINDRMFAYDGNKQAYIADLAAGTYAQLIEAAESCQVAIIHPGKPSNAAEAGLEELLKRAEAFS